jgi:hypothetical protein
MSQAYAPQVLNAQRSNMPVGNVQGVYARPQSMLHARQGYSQGLHQGLAHGSGYHDQLSSDLLARLFHAQNSGQTGQH